jgi:hypothetical protein
MPLLTMRYSVQSRLYATLNNALPGSVPFLCHSYQCAIRFSPVSMPPLTMRYPVQSRHSDTPNNAAYYMAANGTRKESATCPASYE